MDMKLLKYLVNASVSNQELNFDQFRLSYNGDLDAELRKLAHAGYVVLQDGDDGVTEFDLTKKGCDFALKL